MKKGQWAALIAAFLGWMFDGFEIGLFPLVAQPALKDMLPQAAESAIGNWLGVMTAAFLVGAATGGVVFGWLGDRIGRVRAMALSILAYAIFSGACGFVTAPWQLFLFRFLASLGMGGEWSLGVSLVMEIWPNKSRGWLAGAIGAAANVGFVLVAILNLGLNQIMGGVRDGLSGLGVSEEMVARLSSNGGWRLLAMAAATPALLTFVVRVFVPESERWEQEHAKGTTKQWSTPDLLAVVVGAIAALGLVSLWALDDWFRDPSLPADDPQQFTIPMPVRIVGTLIGLVIAYLGYTYPIRRYLQRSLALETGAAAATWSAPHVLRRMLLGATLGGVALLGTWASLQNAAPWAGAMTEDRIVGIAPGTPGQERARLLKTPEAKALMATDESKAAMARARSYTQISSGIAAILFTILAALAGDALGRRLSYFLLCVTALGSSLLFFQFNDTVDLKFYASVFLAGGLTASFYGWLPLYLPELFPTRVRAFGQGFAFNFGRILAAVGALQFSYLMNNVFDGIYPKACTALSFIYVVGMAVIWFAPETKGQPLPE
jgi:MFS family permease